MSEDIKVERFVSVEQIKEDVSFDVAHLDEAMLEQPALLAYYGVLASKAQYQVDRNKQLMEIREAQIAAKIREEAAESGQKLTEKALEQQLVVNSVVVKQRKALNESKEVYEAIRIAVEALKHKKDMIIQFGVRHRMELETQGRILSAKEREDASAAEGKSRVREVMDKVAN